MIQSVVSFAEICRELLPRPSCEGCIAVLTVYFDDSGTHDDSEIIVMAGFLGTESQWAAFDAAWSARLHSANSLGITVQRALRSMMPNNIASAIV